MTFPPTLGLLRWTCRLVLEDQQQHSPSRSQVPQSCPVTCRWKWPCKRAGEQWSGSSTLPHNAVWQANINIQDPAEFYVCRSTAPVSLFSRVHHFFHDYDLLACKKSLLACVQKLATKKVASLKHATFSKKQYKLATKKVAGSKLATF
jgi:hypothetical protein